MGIIILSSKQYSKHVSMNQGQFSFSFFLFLKNFPKTSEVCQYGSELLGEKLLLRFVSFFPLLEIVSQTEKITYWKRNKNVCYEVQYSRHPHICQYHKYPLENIHFQSELKLVPRYPIFRPKSTLVLLSFQKYVFIEVTSFPPHYCDHSSVHCCANVQHR